METMTKIIRNSKDLSTQNRDKILLDRINFIFCSNFLLVLSLIERSEKGRTINKINYYV